MLSESRLNQIIEQEIDKAFPMVGYGGNGTWTKWDPATRAERFKPSNAMRAVTPPRTTPNPFDVVRGYNDWNDNYRGQMTYPQYCEKFGLKR